MRINILCVLFIIHAAVCDNIDVNSSEFAEQLYIKLFKRRRVEQQLAVKSFRRVTNYEKQYSMILLMAEKLFTVVLDSRAQLEASDYIPGISQFPTDQKIKEALSNILENTALFSEILLNFPDVSMLVLKLNNNWDILLQWSIAFSYEVRYLLDKSTLKLLDLVSQELNRRHNDPNYVSSFRKTIKKDVGNQNVAESENTVKTDKKKKRKEIKRGPRLTKTEL